MSGARSTSIGIFIFGLGYSASAFADMMRPRVGRIGGTVRAPDKAAELKGRGFEVAVFDGTGRSRDAANALAEATHLVISVPPSEESDPVLAYHRADIAAAPALRWIGYLSTVGVYGNYGGAWVSERTTPHPNRGRSTVRLDAEKAWRSFAEERGVPLAIFRIAGIYGPGRNAFVNLDEGKARRIVKPGQVFNRIHVTDIAQALTAAAEHSAAGIFNLTDDEPGPPQDVVAYAAGLMGVPVPPDVPFESADLSPMARSFYADNKRVSNRRIKEDLGVSLRYPTYREGLTALWREGTWRRD